MNVIRFDRRATHRIFSEPVALDLVNDLTALTDEAIRNLEAVHWIALGTGDAHLVRGITVAHGRLVNIRDLSRDAAGLIDQSIKVNPYLAAKLAAVA